MCSKGYSIPVAHPSLPPLEEVRRVVEAAIASHEGPNGGLVSLLEQEVASFLNTKEAVAVSSGTAGLMLAFSALNLPVGTEVIVPSYTFPATIQALLWNRLTPVFVDCVPGLLTIDPSEVRKALRPQTGAIVPVSIFGLPPDYDALSEISHESGIPMISDSAQGLGSTYKGRPLGGFGHCEVFSLNSYAVITALEGGLVTANDGEFCRKIRELRCHGNSLEDNDPPGKSLSANLGDFHAAVGLLNLRSAHALIEGRQRLARMYRERIGRLPGCRVQEIPEDRTSNGNYFALFLGEEAKVDRDDMLRQLKSRGIQCEKGFYPPSHSQSFMTGRPSRQVGDLHNTWAAGRSCLTLPLYSDMTETGFDEVCRCVEDLLAW